MSDQPVLRCLGGEPAPPDLPGDIFAASQLPDAARGELWHALGPSLFDPLPPAAERVLDTFASTHKISPDHLGRVIRACRFVVRAAVQRGLSDQELATDLALLTPDAQVVAILLSGYEQAQVSLRGVALERALGLHGERLTGVDYRVDRLCGTRDAPRLDVLVAMFSLELRSADGAKQLRFQADLDAVRALRKACEAIERSAGKT